MKNNAHDATPKTPTLSASLEEATTRGFTANFNVISKGLTLDDELVIYKPENIKIVNFHRFEGYNSPDDSSILYLLETINGGKGTLIDAYGVYADSVISDFIKRVEAIEKKNTVTD